jgi:hypothetical protein
MLQRNRDQPALQSSGFPVTEDWLGMKTEIEDPGRVDRGKSLEVVTASIAFELRQTLSGIVTNANACLRMLAGDPPRFESARETLCRAIRDSGRALEAVTRLESLFGTEGATTESVDLRGQSSSAPAGHTEPGK